MITILDVENTTCKRDGKQHFDPFEAENELVMVGMLQVPTMDRPVKGI
jgi:hypothetical protein